MGRFPRGGAGPSKLTLCSLPFTAGEEPQSEGSITKLIAPLKIAAKPLPPPSAPKALSPPERSGPQPFYTIRGASRAPFLKLAAPAATTTLGPQACQT